MDVTARAVENESGVVNETRPVERITYRDIFKGRPDHFRTVFPVLPAGDSLTIGETEKRVLLERRVIVYGERVFSAINMYTAEN